MGRRPGRRLVRGRTRPGRLSVVDDYFEVAERELVRAEMGGAVFVDIGIGDDPATTLETAARLRAVRPGLVVVGVDVEPGRIRRARAVASHVTWRNASFDWRTDTRERAKIVRIMNVLRAYPAAVRERLLEQLVPTLIDGALVVEGSTCATGDVVAARLIRKRHGSLAVEGVFFATGFRRGFAPEMFRDRMPRDERRGSNAPFAGLFDAWTAVWLEVRERGESDPRACFRACAAGLPALGFEARLVSRLGEHAGLVCHPWRGACSLLGECSPTLRQAPPPQGSATLCTLPLVPRLSGSTV